MESSEVRALFAARRWKRIAVGPDGVVAESPHGNLHAFRIEKNVVREVRLDDIDGNIAALPLLRGREDKERPVALEVLMKQAEQRDLLGRRA